jgi:hypothetical protein
MASVERSALPYQPDQEKAGRTRLGELLANGPVPVGQQADDLALYMSRGAIADLLAMDTLYRMIMDVPGVIMELGVYRGRHLATFTALRALYEPYDLFRQVIGFDTFAGFPDVAQIDQVGPRASAGNFATPSGYADHLRAVLEAHESSEPHGHFRRSMLVEGDVRKTLPEYLERNPHTVVALAYFDMDLYEPTRDALQAIRPYLTEGSILAFDELNHAVWPGETAALRELIGLDHGPLRKLPGRAYPTYLRWKS